MFGMEIDYKSVVLNLMSQEANFQTNKKLIQLLGKDLADLTSYLLDQYSYHDRNETLQEDSSFFCSNFDIYLFSGMKMDTIIQQKKKGIEQQIFETIEKGIPKATYYYLNFKKIFELVSTKKTIVELAYERALKEGYLPEATEEKLSVSVLEKWSFKDLRLFCKKEKISYTGKDRKEMLIQKIIKNKFPDYGKIPEENLVNEISFTSEQKNCSLWKNERSSDLVDSISLTSEQKNCSQVSKKVVTNQELINQEKNHDHEELDFEKLFHEFGVNYTRTNRESIEKLLQKMKPYQVEQYLRELYKNIKENPEVKNINALFSRKIQRQEYQINTPKETTKTEPSSKSKVKNFEIIREKEEQRKKEEEIRKKEEEEIKLISAKLNNFSKEEKTKIYELAESKVKDENMKKSIDTIKRLSGEGRIYLKLIYKNVKEILEEENFR